MARKYQASQDTRVDDLQAILMASDEKSMEIFRNLTQEEVLRLAQAKYVEALRNYLKF